MDSVKDSKYYENKRTDLIKFVPQGAVRVLEIGCGTGQTGAEIKRLRGPGTTVVGVELFPDAALKAHEVLDAVFTGDVEKIELPFKKHYFDCVIYGDVLEHLMDPWRILEKHQEMLKPGGIMIASIPNIAHYRIVRMLKKKEWNYQDSGIMDVTHIRFFALKNIYSMFERAGLKVDKIEHIVSASRVKKLLNKILFNALIDDITEQYIVIARKS
ncbi:MAG TPA: class I SAM-dependent methyltransferase [Candidatus Omnitrophota bacterium]|nr:class I SAM-dependent methyltransferase [Candidatus Omnitrophota bacterium]